MQIKKDGIYRTIDSKDFGLFQQSGWEKVVTEPIVKSEPIKVEEPVVEQKTEPVEEEIMPKAKKKKKA